MDTVPSIRRDEFSDDYVRRSQPCLIVDALEGWPAYERWTPRYLQAAGADKAVTLSVSHSGVWRYHPDHGGDLDPATQYRIPQVPFRLASDWIIDATPGGHKYYLSQSDMLQFPELAADLRFARPLQKSRALLWFGTADTVTPLHYDLVHNLFAQVYGRKTITLYSPREHANLYPNPAGSRLPHLSRVCLEEPDSRAYPTFPQSQPLVVTVEAGQMLFIPVCWWHHVRADTLSISVSQWWPYDLEDLTGATAVAVMRREYRRDQWATLRTSSRWSRAHLIRSAQRLARSEPAIAVMAASIVVEEQERWPTTGGLVPAIADAGTKRRLEALCLRVMAGDDDVAQEEVVPLVEALAASVESGGVAA